MSGMFSPLSGTASIDGDRWLSANSTNADAFAVLPVITAPADFEALDGSLINTSSHPGMAKFGAQAERFVDKFFLKTKIAKNLLLVNFCLVGADDVTATFKITGYRKGKDPITSTPSLTPVTRMVPTPLCTGSLIRGTKATASGVTSEGYCDTIVVNATTGAFVPLTTYSADVQTGLANDVASLLMSIVGYEWLRLEIRKGTATSGNAEFTFL